MSDIVISYAREAEAEAIRVAEALRGLGYAVWRDDEIPAHRAFGLEHSHSALSPPRN
jgi:adenylate cyclase